VVTAIRPDVIATPQAIDLYVERMVVYAMAMVDAEAQRRAPTQETRLSQTPATPQPNNP
jgi:hypothetical protein